MSARALKLSVVLAMTAVASTFFTASFSVNVIGSDGNSVGKSVNVADFPAPDVNGKITVEVDFDAGSIPVGDFTGTITTLDANATVGGTPVTFEGTITDDGVGGGGGISNMQPIVVGVTLSTS